MLRMPRDQGPSTSTGKVDAGSDDVGPSGAATAPVSPVIWAGIELSTKVMSTRHQLACTLLHEMCHLAECFIDGAAKGGHGARFKRWMRRAAVAEPEFPVTIRHTYVTVHKHRWGCVFCKREVGRQGKSIDPAVDGCFACKRALVYIGEACRFCEGQSRGGQDHGKRGGGGGEGGRGRYSKHGPPKSARISTRCSRSFRHSPNLLHRYIRLKYADARKELTDAAVERELRAGMEGAGQSGMVGGTCRPQTPRPCNCLPVPSHATVIDELQRRFYRRGGQEWMKAREVEQRRRVRDAEHRRRAREAANAGAGAGSGAGTRAGAGGQARTVEAGTGREGVPSKPIDKGFNKEGGTE